MWALPSGGAVGQRLGTTRVGERPEIRDISERLQAHRHFATFSGSGEAPVHGSTVYWDGGKDDSVHSTIPGLRVAHHEDGAWGVL